MTALTLSQIEALLLVKSGCKAFSGRSARSIERLFERELVTAEFDLTAPDPLRGRVKEVWRNCSITARGLQVCEAFASRFQPLINSKDAA